MWLVFGYSAVTQKSPAAAQLELGSSGSLHLHANNSATRLSYTLTLLVKQKNVKTITCLPNKASINSKKLAKVCCQMARSNDEAKSIHHYKCHPGDNNIIDRASGPVSLMSLHQQYP